jgi:hypothetical protein
LRSFFKFLLPFLLLFHDSNLGLARVPGRSVPRRRGHFGRPCAAHQRRRAAAAARLRVQRHVFQLRRGLEGRVQGIPASGAVCALRAWATASVYFF